MRITRLYLRAFRVFEAELELDMPAGLVGIYGRNGAGKSSLLEAITWTLHGRARTAKDEIRTSGINTECVTEVEFEHEGHLYLVRRTLSGANSTVRAQSFADGAQVSEGVRDTGRYVHSVLGMDDIAFRASVFAEQKQLAAFSSTAPADRRKLVLQLLGVTPLDTARDQARRDARSTHDQLDRVRTLLPDRQALADGLAVARAGVSEAEQIAQRAIAEAEAARLEAAASASAHETLAEVAREHTALVRDGKAQREERDRSAGRIEALVVELAGLDEAARRVGELEAEAAEVATVETRLRAVEALDEAARALAEVPALPTPAAPNEEAAAAAAAASVRDAGALAAIEGEMAGASAEVDRARTAAERSSSLSGEADCPVCGQALGEAYEQVQAHRASELAEAQARAQVLASRRTELAGAAAATKRAAQVEVDLLASARLAWSAYERATERRKVAEAAHQGAVVIASRVVGRTAEPGERGGLEAELTRRRKAGAEAARLRGRLERRADAQAQLEADRALVADLDGRLEDLREKVKALRFHPDQLEAAHKLRREAQERLEGAARVAEQTRGSASAAVSLVEREAARLADAEAQHAKLVELEDEARHLGRVADLLTSFRNTIVATVGPRLSAQAADLFAELTDREYDLLKVDPDTYEIQIVDGGISYGMDRFSGSETDLANLALRVAISEHVRFQSGGTVGLLVLDEVFGPLDEDRKEKMLLALERLRGRFRQILVVTHASDIKEQLPSAIEVVKLAGRRATARVVNG